MKQGGGTVIKSTGSQYLVKIQDGRIIPCSIRGKFRIKGIRATNPVAVGDQVDFEWLEDHESGIITSIHERSNYIIRRSSNLSKEYQLVATNVDLAWLMISMTLPRTLTPFIDRFLVSAEAYRLPVIILFNKIDLYGPEEKEEMDHLKAVYTDIGYTCMQMSLQTREGVGEVRREMSGKVNVISGNSGVGKSTLVHVLDPSVRLKIGNLRSIIKRGNIPPPFQTCSSSPEGSSSLILQASGGSGPLILNVKNCSIFFLKFSGQAKNANTTTAFICTNPTVL